MKGRSEKQMESELTAVNDEREHRLQKEQRNDSALGIVMKIWKQEWWQTYLFFEG